MDEAQQLAGLFAGLITLEELLRAIHEVDDRPVLRLTADPAGPLRMTLAILDDRPGELLDPAALTFTPPPSGRPIASHLPRRLHLAFVPGRTSNRGSKSTIVAASLARMLTSPCTFAVPSLIWASRVNLSERTLRAIALGRKNWKFVGSAKSGASAAIHYTVVGSCRHLGIDPFAYLREVLPKMHALGTKATDEQLTELLPDAWARRLQAATVVTTVAA